MILLPNEPGPVVDRVQRHAAALQATGHCHPEHYTYVDSATNVDMSSSRADAVQVTEIPFAARPTIAGVGGGLVPTHYVDRMISPELRMPGINPIYRSMWSPEVRYNIISTTTLGRMGLDVFTVAAEQGQMYLSPSGLDPRDERTRVRCVRVGGLHAIPTETVATPAPTPTRFPPGLTIPSHCHPPTAAVAAVHPADDDGGDSIGHTPTDDPDQSVNTLRPPTDETDSLIPTDDIGVNTPVPLDLDDEPHRVLRRQRRPIPYTEFRQRIGNPSHDEALHAAKRMGVRLIGAGSHRERLDRERATANQTATAARKVSDPGIFHRAQVTVITDTVGPLPVSALRNRYFQSWFLKGNPEYIVVTCSPDKSATSSWTGFEEFARTRGITLLRDAISQSVEFVHDAGTEYLGVFLQQCQRAGFVQRSATPHKDRKFEAHPSEGANRRLQAQMRVNLVGARDRFAAWGLDARAYWDRAAVYGARELTVRSHCKAHDVAYDQLVRELLAPGFGALGTVKVQAGDTANRQPGGKQLADRSVPGLFIGVTPNHKSIMLLRDASVMVTSDVRFHTPTTPHISSPDVDRVTTSKWMDPIDSALDHQPDSPLSVTPDVDTSATTITSPPDVTSPTRPTTAPTDEPTLTDSAGHTVHIGDHVTVTQNDSTRQGIVTDIDLTDYQTPGGEVRVDYGDGVTDFSHYPLKPHRRVPMRKLFDSETHRALIGIHSAPACFRLSVQHPPQPPHPSVRPYLDDHGNILPQYLDGSATLPPPPPLPAHDTHIVTPASTSEALASPEAIFWLHSHLHELRGHMAPANRPATFHYTTTRPEGRRLHIKFVYTVKRNQDGTINKFKGRAVIAGWWLRRGVHYAESYTGQTPWSDVRDLEALGVQLGLRVYEADLVQAYPFASMPPSPDGSPVVAQMPPSSRMYAADGNERFVHVDQAWYGHPAAGFALATKLCRCFTGRNILSDEEQCTVPLLQHPNQPVVFKAQYPSHHKWHHEIFWLHVSTDNLRTYTSCPDIQREFMRWLDRNFETTGGIVALQDQEPQTFNGVRFTYVKGAVQLDMPAYIAKLLDEVGLSHTNPAVSPLSLGTIIRLDDQPHTAADQLAVVTAANKVFNTHYTTYSEIITFYGHLVSSIGWIASKVGTILLFPHSLLCRVLSAPTAVAFKALKRVLRYLAGWPTMHITYVPDRLYDWRHGDWPTHYAMQSDASYADDPDDRRSQGAHIGGFRGQAVTTAVSRKGHRVATSTDQAEAQHAGAACKQCEYKRKFFDFLGIPTTAPTHLQLDNYATYLRHSAPIRKWSPASKQHDVLEKYIVECAERGIIKPIHAPGHLPPNPRPGDGFKVDALTKILSTAATQFYARELHGPDLRGDLLSNPIYS